jgi:hypothetical protein
MELDRPDGRRDRPQPLVEPIQLIGTGVSEKLEREVTVAGVDPANPFTRDGPRFGQLT